MPTSSVTLTMRTVRSRPGVKLLVLKKPGVPVIDSVEETSTVPVLPQKKEANTRTAVNVNEAASPPLKKPKVTVTLSKERLTYLKQNKAAIVRIQAILRGTRARWNLPVLKLQAKLDAIRKLKDKQLKKLEQRKEHRKQDLRIEMEHTFTHRRLMRRLQKAEFLKSHFGKLKEREEQEQKDLTRLCQDMKQKTIEIRQGMFRSMQEQGRVRMEIAKLGQKQSKLQRECEGFQKAIELFQEAIAATTKDSS